MNALIYLIFICNSGGACTQANNDATFMTPQTCLQELPKLYYGRLEKSGKFYVRDWSRDTWLECVGAREDDDRIVWTSTHHLPPREAVTDAMFAAHRRLQQSLIRLDYAAR
jgi:hypothetical protein